MTWEELAKSAREAALRCYQCEEYRSSVARAYYAAYSLVTHRLVTQGVTFPNNREGPSHSKLRPTVEGRLNRPADRNVRINLSMYLGKLYTLRISADYQPSVEVGEPEAKMALAYMHNLFNRL